MIFNKSANRISILPTALFLILACTWQTWAVATANRSHASQALQSSLGMQGSKTVEPVTPKPVYEELDTFFALNKRAFDKMAVSPVLKAPRLVTINSFFMQLLKAHLPWYSLIKTDKGGAVINEVIRIEGVSREKRSVSDQPWFRQVAKTKKEYTGMIKMEKTGRYYLLWAAPVVIKIKGTETFRGAVAIQIDVWDCFDRFADKATTPFMVKILGRVTLYDHLWNDTIAYLEKPLTVPGIDKIAVRYPGLTSEATAARTADSLALVQARLDSTRIAAARDLAAKASLAKKAKTRKTAIIALAVIVLLIVVVGIVLLVMSRRRARGVDAEAGGHAGADAHGSPKKENTGRFDSL